MLFKGPPVQDSAQLFRKIWNEQCDRLASVKTADADRYTALKIDGSRVSQTQNKYEASVELLGLLDHSPKADGFDAIYMGIMKSIEASKKTIDIANAYVILTPGMKNALLRARERGVKVRILTNSSKSVDEPIVSAPILKSLAEMLPSKCEIYVKNGDTLHSKYAVFDGQLTWVMSYNLHPRSLRYEGEVANVIIDDGFAKSVTEAYEADLAIAKPIHVEADLDIPSSKLANVGMHFFDQL